MILPRLRRNLECPADQVFASIVRRIRTPGPLRASTRQVPPMTTRRALPRRRSGRTARRCRDALTLAARHEMHRVEVPVSPSGADSSAGASASPRLSAGQLLASKNTRPIQSLDDLAAASSGPTRNWRKSWPSPTPSATATSPDRPPCSRSSSPRHRRRLVSTPAEAHRPLATRLIAREPQRTSECRCEECSICGPGGDYGRTYRCLGRLPGLNGQGSHCLLHRIGYTPQVPPAGRRGATRPPSPPGGT
jgi:hypothetical protein